jgi:hypothetical protein
VLVKTVKQPEASKSCVLACLAMICGKTYEQIAILRGARSDPAIPIGFVELTEILLQHQKIAGLLVNWETGVTIDTKTTVSVDVACKLADHDAILSVSASRTPKLFHAVVWDRKKAVVRDPLPHLPNTTDLSAYRVHQWIPITDLASTGWNL